MAEACMDREKKITRGTANPDRKTKHALSSDGSSVPREHEIAISEFDVELRCSGHCKLVSEKIKNEMMKDDG